MLCHFQHIVYDNVVLSKNASNPEMESHFDKHLIINIPRFFHSQSESVDIPIARLLLYFLPLNFYDS